MGENHSGDEKQAERTELLFEYDQLRKEILNNFTLGIQILGGTVTFVAGIMTLAFSQAASNLLGKASLFFVAETIAFIGLNQTMNLANSTFQIASYLRVFTEASLKHLKWETRLHRFRDNLGDVPYEEHTTSVRYTYAFIIIVNFVLASIFVLRGTGLDITSHTFTRTVKSVSIPATALILIVLCVTVYLLRLEWKHYWIFVIDEDKTYATRWKIIRSEEPEVSENIYNATAGE